MHGDGMADELVELREIISGSGKGEDGVKVEAPASRPEEGNKPHGHDARIKPAENHNGNAEVIKQEAASMPAPEQEKDEEVPLFVKVEKYEDLLSIIDEIKELDAKISEVEKLEEHAMSILSSISSARKSMKAGIEARLRELDGMLVRPAGMRKRPRELRQFDSLLAELRAGIEQIRHEVARLS